MALKLDTGLQYHSIYYIYFFKRYRLALVGICEVHKTENFEAPSQSLPNVDG